MVCLIIELRGGAAEPRVRTAVRKISRFSMRLAVPACARSILCVETYLSVDEVSCIKIEFPVLVLSRGRSGNELLSCPSFSGKRRGLDYVEWIRSAPTDEHPTTAK